MLPPQQNFSIYAGDSKNLVVTVTKEDGSALDLSNGTLRWGFDTLVKTTSSGIVLTNASGGIFTITLSPLDTQDRLGTFPHGGTFTDVAGNISTILVGNITILKKVI